MMTANQMRTAALAYVQAEVFTEPVSIFPVNPNGNKRPLTEHGQNDASSDPSQIMAWWDRWPDANIGLPLEVNGLCAIDLDGAEGIATLRDIRPEYPVPLSCGVRTGGDGWHLIYAVPPGRRPRGTAPVFPGIDLRGPNYLVAPPSLHESGKRYRWAILPWQLAPVRAPEWILHPVAQPRPVAALRPAPTTDAANTSYGRCALRMISEEMAATAEGGRNHKLYAATRRVLELIHDNDLVDGDLDVLRDAAAASGLREHEIEFTIASAIAGTR